MIVSSPLIKMRLPSTVKTIIKGKLSDQEGQLAAKCQRLAELQVSLLPASHCMLPEWCCYTPTCRSYRPTAEVQYFSSANPRELSFCKWLTKLCLRRFEHCTHDESTDPYPSIPPPPNSEKSKFWKSQYELLRKVQ